jgi:hypothetical protein
MVLKLTNSECNKRSKVKWICEKLSGMRVEECIKLHGRQAKHSFLCPHPNEIRCMRNLSSCSSPTDSRSSWPAIGSRSDASEWRWMWVTYKTWCASTTRTMLVKLHRMQVTRERIIHNISVHHSWISFSNFIHQTNNEYYNHDSC